MDANKPESEKTEASGEMTEDQLEQVSGGNYQAAAIDPASGDRVIIITDPQPGNQVLIKFPSPQ